jgi:hypothetical protein
MYGDETGRRKRCRYMPSAPARLPCCIDWSRPASSVRAQYPAFQKIKAIIRYVRVTPTMLRTLKNLRGRSHGDRIYDDPSDHNNAFAELAIQVDEAQLFPLRRHVADNGERNQAANGDLERVAPLSRERCQSSQGTVAPGLRRR